MVSACNTTPVFILLCTIIAFAGAALPHPSPSADPAAGWPRYLPDSCKCMAARNKYWATQPDVKNANLDPVFHYQNGGYKEGRAWDCNLCNTNPIWPNNTLCNCNRASADFVAFYPGKGLAAAEAFAYWTEWTPYFNMTYNGGMRWHCDWCMEDLGIGGGSGTTGSIASSTTGSSTTYTLTPECKCWEAREKYWSINVDVFAADMDPAYHYQASGGKEGRTWDCSMCDHDPIESFDPRCNCSTSAQKFIDDHSKLGATIATAWNIWKQRTTAGESLAWHPELCIPELQNILDSDSDNPTQHYDLAWECQCVQAGDDYLIRNPDVATAMLDPVYHYEASGYFQDRPWNCDFCKLPTAVWYNDSLCNCSDAIQEYGRVYTAFQVPPGQSWSYWWNIGKSFGQAWNCSVCIPDPVEPAKVRDFSVGVSGGLGAVVGVGAIVGIFAAVILAMFWDAFSKHGSFYCGVIIAGVCMSYLAALTQLPRPTDALCIAFPWLLGVAFILVYGCLFIKTWALYRVWMNASKFKRTNLTPTTILKIIGVALVVECVFLAIWTAIDPPKVKLEKTVNDDLQHMCKTKNMVFWSIFIGVKGAWLVFGAVLSILTRNIAKEYSDSKSIGYAIYNDIALLVIAVPLAILLQDIPGGVLVIEVAIIVLTFTFTMCILFFDIWWGIFFPEAVIPVKMAGGKTSSGGAAASSTTMRSSVSATHSANSSHSSA